MTRRHNVNDNGNFRMKINNVNEKGSKYSRSCKVDSIADDLVRKLGAKTESRPFFCKVAWKLPEARIWNNFELASKGNNPTGLFIYLCKKDGV